MQCDEALTQVRDLAVQMVGLDGIVLTVPADGTDVADVLQAEVDTVPDGSTMILPPGRYRCEKTIGLLDRHDLIWEAVGAVLYTTSSGPLDSQGRSHRSQVAVRGSTNITIRGLRLESWVTGYDSSGLAAPYRNEYEFEHGFTIGPVGSKYNFFSVCKDIVLDGCSVRDVGGDGVWVYSVLVGPQGERWNLNPERITLRNVLIEKTGRQGVGVVGAVGLTVEDSTVIARRTAIDLENVGGTIGNALIRNCFLRGSNGAVNAQSSNPDCNDVTVEGCVAIGGIRSTGLADQHRQAWKVNDNIWPGPPSGIDYPNKYEGNQFWFKHIDGVEVQRNYYRVGLKRRHNRTVNGALFLCDDTDVTVANNDFRGQNRLWNQRSCIQDAAEVTESCNTGIWEGPISVNEPYPPEYDPSVDRTWTLDDFPQLDPPPNATAGHWDGLVRGTGIV